ncbi:MAG: MBL fold metallo-hydrolase [Muribaculaceae bacterium]|nr:MBL fold metallo-hydrolase [Roseburia sp.]MCM1430324.1 MBL fold metallo-hydrolase [Muribaculaceae bacterium]MCM1492480.1 MBL fold metallo-hydrolase [Muribaculaceae bacterium]
MQVIFIHHSCFLVELDGKVLIFDYFAGDRVNGYTFSGRIPDYAPETKIYMFASHSHKDHYDMDILRMAESYPNIHYILSKDIRISPNFLKKHGIDPGVREHVTFVTHGQHYEVDGLSIDTLQSTDSGVAFYVETDGVQMFHAGDLNDWRMEGAGDIINGKMKRAYRHEIKKLSDKPMHLAFIPMDPRLGEYQFSGIDFFLKNTDAEYVFPMHMWQDYSGIAAYRKRLTNSGMAQRVMEVSRENQVFFFQD